MQAVIAAIDDTPELPSNAALALSSALVLRATLGLRDTFSSLSHPTHLQSIDHWIGFETSDGKLWCRIVNHDGAASQAVFEDNPTAILHQITQLEPIIVKLEGLLGQALIPNIVQSSPTHCLCMRVTEGGNNVDIQLPMAMVMNFEMPEDARPLFANLNGNIQFDASVLAPALSNEDVESLSPGDMILWPESASERTVVCTINDPSGNIKWPMSAQLPQLSATRTSNIAMLNWSVCWKNVSAAASTISGKGDPFKLPVDEPAIYYRDNIAIASVYLVPFGNGFSLLVDNTDF